MPSQVRYGEARASAPLSQESVALRLFDYQCWCSVASEWLRPTSQNLKSSDILCRLDPVRKFEAGLDHLPGLHFQPSPVDRPLDPATPILAVGLHHLGLGEAARFLRGLVLLAHDGTGEADQGFDGREHLHHTRPALYLAVGPLLHVVGPEALPVRGREVEVGQCVGLGLLEDPIRLRAARLEHVAGHVVHGGHGRGVPSPEDRREGAADPPPEPPRPRLAHAVAHEADGAPLPRSTLEDLAERADEPRAGVGGHAALPATLHVGRVQPDVGHGRAVERPAAQLVDVGVERRGDGAHLVLAEPGDAHLLGDALHLLRAGAGGVHLGHGRGEGAVHSLVVLDRVAGKKLPVLSLGMRSVSVPKQVARLRSR